MNISSRLYLGTAARHIARAQSLRSPSLRREYLAMARDAITRARRLFALELQTAHVRHAYAKDGAQWRGVLLAADGAAAWRSCRVYAHRQSAQRAALAAMAGWLTTHY